VKGSGDGDPAARGEGFWQEHFYDIDIKGVVLHFCFLAVDAKVEAVDITAFFFIREVELGAAVAEELFAEGGAIVLVGVGPKVEPDEGEGIGGVVGVLDAGEAVEAFFGVVEGDVDGVVYLLLPVGLRLGGLRPHDSAIEG